MKSVKLISNKKKSKVAVINKNQNTVIFYPTKVSVEGVYVALKKFFPVVTNKIVFNRKINHPFVIDNSSNSQMRFKECVDNFWKDAQTRIMRSTLQNYQSKLHYLYTSPLAKVRMSELKGINIVEWINWLKKHPTANNKIRKTFIAEIKLLSVILIWYKNFINENFNVPITKKHKQMCFYKHRSPRRPDYFMKPDDARKWVEWLKEYKRNPVYWRLATFMLLTGARVGEACGLKWSAIDLEDSFVRVIRRVRWDKKTKHPFMEEVTKNSQSVRILNLPDRLQRMLVEMKKEATNNIVFTDIKGDLLKYNIIQSSFNAGFKALDLPWRSTHICRHTYATIALMATNNLSAVQASLGHSAQKTTQVYAKTVALLNSKTGEETSSVIFKDSPL